MPVGMNPPKAFFSYVHLVDQHDNGRLTLLRERLQGEIRVQTRLNVEVFQDIAAIKWGDRWSNELIESLSEAYFLIPIITPGYFLSDACREEYNLFKQRQAKLGPALAGVILPVYYIETDEMNDPAWREGNEWANEIHAFQWFDWRPVRFESWESPAPHRIVAKMARDFKERLKIMGVLRPAGGGSPVAAARTLAVERADAKPPAPTLDHAAEPRPRRELVVDARGKGDFTTIGDAIRAARTDGVIVVKPGTYREAIVLDKSLTLIGDGPRDAIVVETKGADALKCTASFGRVTNFTLRQTSRGQRWSCVDITAGSIELDHCDLTSQAFCCLVVRGHADPTVRRNRIHDGRYAGILVHEHGRGTFEDNDIFANALSGILVKEGGDPTVRRNRIRDAEQNGVFIYGHGRGTFEDNDILASGYSGIEVKDGGHPTVRRNRIRDTKQNGVFVHSSGRGTFEDNEILASRYVGIDVRKGGDPVVRENRITGNGYQGIRVHEGGRGTFVDNDLRGNRGGPWDVADDCLPHVKRERNIER